MVNDAKARSEYVYDVEVTADDKILTLSTCTVKIRYQQQKTALCHYGQAAPLPAHSWRRPHL